MLNLLPENLAKILRKFSEIVPEEVPFYIVGGAVRDILIGRQVHDLDLALPENVLKTARKLADAVGAAYYPLDEERDTARIILMPKDQPRLVIDLASLRGNGIEEDLRGRDFTINAIAINLRQPTKLIDPLHGAADLHAKRLRVCSDRALLDDPVRVLRAFRVAFSYQLVIVPETRQLLHQAVSRLSEVSIERLRDELFRILSGSHAAQAIRALDLFGALNSILPELADLKNLSQSPPHALNGWEHTLAVVNRLQMILSVLDTVHDQNISGNLAAGLVSMRLGRFRDQIAEHINSSLTPERSIRSLLLLSALYHDAAKPSTQKIDDTGRIRFFNHDLRGGEVIAERAKALRLSSDECERLKLTVRHHMRPMLLAQNENLPSRRAVYRFFRDSGPAGIDVCLLSLADFLGTHGVELPQEAWGHHIDVVREILASWWERKGEVVHPPRLVDGNQIIQRFGLEPGPEIGRLLEAVQEAQAGGDVETSEDAFILLEKIINGE